MTNEERADKINDLLKSIDYIHADIGSAITDLSSLFVLLNEKKKALEKLVTKPDKKETDI
jgi:hypothetical protein